MQNVSAGLITTWIVVSGLAFVMSITLNVVLIMVALKLWKKLEPMMDNTQTQLNDLNKKVVDLSAKIDKITDGVQETIGLVQSRAKMLLGKAEEASDGAVKKVNAASTAMTAIMVGARLYGAWKSSQAAKQNNK